MAAAFSFESVLEHCFTPSQIEKITHLQSITST